MMQELPKPGTSPLCPLRSHHITDRQFTKVQGILNSEICGDMECNEEASLRMLSNGCFSVGLTIAHSDSPCFPGTWIEGMDERAREVQRAIGNHEAVGDVRRSLGNMRRSFGGGDSKGG